MSLYKTPSQIILFSAFFLLVVFVNFPAYSQQEAKSDEINFLLKNIEEAQCTFYRNDKPYDSEEALEHVKKKYNFFKSRIKTAEEFIEMSATKSLITGKYYYIECPNGERIKFSDWLYKILNEYRDEKNH